MVKFLTIMAGCMIAGAASAAPVDVSSQPRFAKLQQHDSEDQRERGWTDDGGRIVHAVSPDKTDPAIRRYLRDNIAVVRKDALQGDGRLFLYLVGTGGAPDDAKLIVDTAARQGYHVISLMYNDMPATAQACQKDPEPKCAGNFREKRIFGTNVTSDIDDRPEESVVHRLSAMLTFLDRSYPKEGWGAFADGNAIHWDRIAVSGHSQGAGIAAYIAKRHPVARVALFSSPWDYYHAGGPDGPRTVSPWLNDASATPADRWFAACHQKEPQAANIAIAYRALAIPADHVRIFTLSPRDGHSEHGSVSSDSATPRAADGTPAYLDDWKFLIGTGN